MNAPKLRIHVNKTSIDFKQAISQYGPIHAGACDEGGKRETE